MKVITSKPDSVTIQQAIQDAEKEIRSFVEAETDPMLRGILGGRIDISLSNIVDSIEKKYLEGSVITGDDGSIDTLRSTIETDLLEYVRRSLEETKTNYMLQVVYANDPANNKVIYANEIIAFFSIKEEWDLWAVKQQLLADEAIPLMNGVDPTSWKEYKKGIKHLPDNMFFSIERCLKIAQAKGFVVGTPTEWLDWGRRHDLNKPVLKSKEWLNEPDVCMFYLFEAAVNETSKPFIHTDSMEEKKKEDIRDKMELNSNRLCEDKELETATDNHKETDKNATEQSEPKIHTLFVPMNKKAITLLFDKINESTWKELFSRAARNGLKNIREDGNKYNPAKVAEWLVSKGYYTSEHINRRLANNLPECNKDKKYLITGDFE